MVSRRHVLTGAGALALAPPVFAQARDKLALWDNANGPHLRGAVLVQRRVYPQIDGPEFLGPGPVGAPISDEALDLLAQSGANLAILSLPGIFTETAPYRLDGALFEHLDQLVRRCADRGLYVVIGFRTGPGRSEFTFHRESGGDWFDAALIDERVWSDFDCHSGWALMWEETARRLRARPNVAGYLLMVEPNANQARPGGEVWETSRLAALVRNTPADWPALAQRITARIRSVDPQTPILISPDGYASAGFAPLLDLNRHSGLVLCLHDYSPRDYTHQGMGGGMAFNPAEALIAPPVARRWMVGEFGAVRWAPDLPGFIDRRIAGLEAGGAGWAWFNWDSGWRIYEDQENRFNLNYGADPNANWSAHGGPALDRLRRYWRGNIARPEQILRR